MRWRLRRTTYGTSSLAVIERSSPPPRTNQIEPVRPEIFAEIAAAAKQVPNDIPIGYRSRLGH